VFWNRLNQVQLPVPFVFMLDAIPAWRPDGAQQSKVAGIPNWVEGEICCCRKLQHYQKSMVLLSQLKSVAF